MTTKKLRRYIKMSTFHDKISQSCLLASACSSQKHALSSSVNSDLVRVDLKRSNSVEGISSSNTTKARTSNDFLRRTDCS
mmetsp:Transcript_9641/g.18097  ORF Transcript_9641/g.18097 Transcript_9641/m.18097 type:complete len:80 (-) Transcript_9641:1149-1388(-)